MRELTLENNAIRVDTRAGERNGDASVLVRNFVKQLTAFGDKVAVPLGVDVHFVLVDTVLLYKKIRSKF